MWAEADLQRGFGSGAETLPNVSGVEVSWQDCKGGQGWACPEKERGVLCLLRVEEGERKFLPFLRSLPVRLCGLGGEQQK